LGRDTKDVAADVRGAWTRGWKLLRIVRPGTGTEKREGRKNVRRETEGEKGEGKEEKG
jgi:hypothetical protein